MSIDSIDQKIDTFIEPIANDVFSVVFYQVEVFGASFPLVLAWLVLGSVFFTFYLRFINLRGAKHAFKLIRGDYSDPKAPGRITHFQALATELSGTVGLGNIAGVAIAISAGGPGAVLWMILCGFFGMSLKFAEGVMGVKYRYADDAGHVHGGPMYYLRAIFTRWGKPKLGHFVGAVYSVAFLLAAIGGVALFQANQMYSQLIEISGGAEKSFLVGNAWLVGVIIAMTVGVVIIGGIKTIASWASRIVPLMAAIYITGCLVVLGANIELVPAAFAKIISAAFTGEALGGGLIGAIIAGVQRAAFSNEAGLGSAAVAHAAVKTNDPVTEGFVAMTGPFFDTIVVCTMTALVIIVTGAYENVSGVGGIEITSASFGTVVSWFPYVLTVAVLLFGFSTMISWAYYSAKVINYLFDESARAEKVYNYILCVLIVVGVSTSMSNVINLMDAFVFILPIFNIFALYLLAPELKADLTTYLAKIPKR